MKKNSKTFLTVLATSLLVSCAGRVEIANYQVIPLPQEIVSSQENPFILDGSTKIMYPEGNERMQRNAMFLMDYIKAATGKTLPVAVGSEGKNAIILNLGLGGENKEAYQLKVNSTAVNITAPTEAGVFYGIQTLRKSIPATAMGADVSLPAVEINDYPRFAYRGMMLDVARHFFTVDSVKQYIDMLALHNVNTFHWHLSDDQGWRIEIKKHPKLTDVGSMRTETVIGHNTGEFDGKPYGGFYTQDEVKEIVSYAKDRYITIIPEIDLPGHMLAALKAYPHLGCTGGPYEVGKEWGVFDDVLCAGNDSTIAFIEDVFAEIVELFPSELIHIGGDECPKVRWAACPKCQARIKAEGIKADQKHSAEEYLQSYVISHAEKFLNSKGRRIIGWDEILEGGLAPNATVMSWRGMGGGIEAAKQKHNVIMAPNTYAYFDYYQTKDTDHEPMAIGGYVPVETVYSLDPVPASLTDDEKKYIIGAQANLWTEYITNFKQVQYMVLPRMAALSEVQWTEPEKKDYDQFLTRIPHMIELYKNLGYNYAKHLFDVKVDLLPNEAESVLDVTLSVIDSASVYYTLDGSEPGKASTKYTEPLKIKENCTLKCVAVRENGNSNVFSENIVFSKATAKPITMNTEINKQYQFNGASVLIDGLKGNLNYKTGRWIAFYKNDMEAVIDLKESTELSSAEIGTCVVKGDWVFDARSFAVAVSEDGNAFKEVASEQYPEMKKEDKDGVYSHKLSFTPVKARYVKIMVKSEQKIPAWHGGKGNPGFLFIDEVVLN